jgi:hypothetical protein
MRGVVTCTRRSPRLVLHSLATFFSMFIVFIFFLLCSARNEHRTPGATGASVGGVKYRSALG